jgi:hypothetical protein
MGVEVESVSAEGLTGMVAFEYGGNLITEDEGTMAEDMVAKHSSTQE